MSGFVLWFTGLSAAGKTTIAGCARRDPKGLYAAAFAGEIDDSTGVSAPYEEPTSPELRLDTTGATPTESAAIVPARLEALNVVPAEIVL